MVIVFDVNGTLLDYHALEPQFLRIFNGRYSVDQWFTELVQYSMAISLAGRFAEFGDIATAVLEMAASTYRVRLDDGELRDVRAAMQSLPAFPEVRHSLERLRANGSRIAALSNSGTSALQNQLRNAGIHDYFERAVSVAAVKRYKPAPEVYRFAARTLRVPLREILMVAAHPWDLLGAATAGCRTALVTRYGAAPFRRFYAPDLVVAVLDRAFAAVMDRVARDKVSHRTAAMAIGVDKVRSAKRVRGLFP